MAHNVAILALRKSIGLSQEKLAQKLNVRFATVNRWERGHHIPSRLALRAIRQVARRHGVNYDDLLEAAIDAAQVGDIGTPLDA